MLARQTGVALAPADTARRVLRWLALRGSPPGNRARPDISLLTAPAAPGALLKPRGGRKSDTGPISAAECRRRRIRRDGHIGDNRIRRQIEQQNQDDQDQVHSVALLLSRGVRD
jgi:hypothetical protein